MYKRVIDDLKRAYDRSVGERDKREISSWKVEQRQHFLSLLRTEGKNKLLEIGAGTGVHGQFFQENGVDVICADLSPEMVKRCREKGLEAYEMDFLNLAFPQASFDSLFAMNCLLHVPKVDLPKVLEAIQWLLQPGGLFYWGQYGGIEQEGSWDEDQYTPKRFFSFLSDKQAQDFATQFFDLISFDQIEFEGDEMHFQAMVLRRI